MRGDKGLRFGPDHPYRRTDQDVRKSAIAGKRASPWNKQPMCAGKKARVVFDRNNAKRLGSETCS